MVEYGEGLLDRLASALGAASAARSQLADDRLFTTLADGRSRSLADAHRAVCQDVLLRAEAMAKADLDALGRVFATSGELTSINAAGAVALGRFTLTGHGREFTVIIDSEDGALVSRRGGTFTQVFARIAPRRVRERSCRDGAAA